jgi:hypothetical protein
MNLFEIEIRRKYKCDRYDGQYFGTIKEKRDGQIGVVMGDKVGTPGDPGDRLGTHVFIHCSAGIEPGLRLRRLAEKGPCVGLCPCVHCGLCPNGRKAKLLRFII